MRTATTSICLFLLACNGTRSDSAVGDSRLGETVSALSSPTTVALTSPVTFDALYVVNGAGNSLSVVNTETMSVIGTVQIKNAKFPHHVNLSPDRSKLAVACPGMDMSGGHHGGMPGMPGALLVLDAITGATVVSTMLPEMNHNGAWSSDGKEIWTSQMVPHGTVLVLDSGTLATKNTIPVGDSPEEVTFSLDGKTAFVANGQGNTVSIIDVASKAVVHTLSTDADPVGAWPGANGLMYVSNETAKALNAIDSSGALKTHYNLGYTPGMVSTPPVDDGSVWVADEDTGSVHMQMTTMDMDEGSIATGAGAHGLRFSDDGKTLFVTNQGAGSVSVIDVATMSVAQTLTVGLKPNGLVFRSK